MLPRSPQGCGCPPSTSHQDDDQEPSFGHAPVVTQHPIAAEAQGGDGDIGVTGEAQPGVWPLLSFAAGALVGSALWSGCRGSRGGASSLRTLDTSEVLGIPVEEEEGKLVLGDEDAQARRGEGACEWLKLRKAPLVR